MGLQQKFPHRTLKRRVRCALRPVTDWNHLAVSHGYAQAIDPTTSVSVCPVDVDSFSCECLRSPFLVLSLDTKYYHTPLQSSASPSAPTALRRVSGGDGGDGATAARASDITVRSSPDSPYTRVRAMPLAARTNINNIFITLFWRFKEIQFSENKSYVETDFFLPLMNSW